MATRNNRVLYLGTADGLYRAQPEGESYDAEVIAFQGAGSFRAPVVVDCENPEVLYAGTTRVGMFRSPDSGKRWQEINQGITYKNIWSIVQHPRTGTLFVGTSPACAFISGDRGDTWTECDQLETLPTTKGWHGPLPPHVSRLKDISLCAEDPARVYGAIEEGWAIRSLDGGTNWEQIDDGVDHDGHSIKMIAGNPNVVVASTGKGIFRSEDEGNHWSESNDGLAPRCYTPAPLVSHHSRPNVLLTAVTATGPAGWSRPGGGDTAFARSDDQGRTWRVSTQGLPAPCAAVPRGLAVDPDAPDTYVTGMTDGSVWLSDNGGESFRQILGGLPAVMSVCISLR